MESKNKYLQLESGILIDTRMTDETKEYIKNMMITARPIDIIKLPPVTIRQARVDLIKKTIKTLNFENLLPTRVISFF